jgi:hypothetical protein
LKNGIENYLLMYKIEHLIYRTHPKLGIFL